MMHCRPYNGVHGDNVGVVHAALCALDLEVPGVVIVGWDEFSEVFEFGLDLKRKNRLLREDRQKTVGVKVDLTSLKTYLPCAMVTMVEGAERKVFVCCVDQCQISRSSGLP